MIGWIRKQIQWHREWSQCRAWCAERYKDHCHVACKLCFQNCSNPIPGDRCSNPHDGVSYPADGSESMYCGQKWKAS